MFEPVEELSALVRLGRGESFPTSPLTPEQVETRVDRVISQVARGAYADAARAAETLLGEGLLDVRLVTPYAFGAFLNKGPGALPALFASLHQVFTRGWEGLGPAEKKPAFADSGLLWLFKTIHKHLSFHGPAQDEVWKGWSETFDLSRAETALQEAGELVGALEQRVPGGGGIDQLLRITGWLTENRDLFAAAPAAPVRLEAEKPEPPQKPEAPRKEPPAPREEVPVKAVEETEDEEEEEDDMDEVEEDEVEEDEPAPHPAPLRSRPTPIALPPRSPALEQLLRKLAAFDLLVEREDFNRASLVAADMLQVIDHFDPLVYLPELFCRFLSGLNANAAKIEPLMQAPSSLSTRALERLYRADLQTFLDAPPRARTEP